jgi:hypothetical protein
MVALSQPQRELRVKSAVRSTDSRYHATRGFTVEIQKEVSEF